MTPENFAKWKANFLKETAMQKQKALEESQAILSAKERELERKITLRPTGNRKLILFGTSG